MYIRVYIILLDSGKWLDVLDETFSKQMQHVSKEFHPLRLAIYLPIHHYGGGLRPHPQQWGPHLAAPHCRGFQNGGCGDKWRDKVDDTFLKHFAIVSKMLHSLHLSIYLPIHHYGGGLRPPPQQWGLPSAAPHRCGFHSGGWGDEWLDTMDESFLKQLQNVSKAFHPFDLAIYLTIHHCGVHNSGWPPKAAPTVVEAAEGCLHNGGWWDKLQDKVDETCLKHFTTVSETCHPFYPGIDRCPENLR